MPSLLPVTHNHTVVQVSAIPVPVPVPVPVPASVPSVGQTSLQSHTSLTSTVVVAAGELPPLVGTSLPPAPAQVQAQAAQAHLSKEAEAEVGETLKILVDISQTASSTKGGSAKQSAKKIVKLNLSQSPFSCCRSESSFVKAFVSFIELKLVSDLRGKAAHQCIQLSYIDNDLDDELVLLDADSWSEICVSFCDKSEEDEDKEEVPEPSIEAVPSVTRVPPPGSSDQSLVAAAVIPRTPPSVGGVSEDGIRITTTDASLSLVLLDGILPADTASATSDPTRSLAEAAHPSELGEVYRKSLSSLDPEAAIDTVPDLSSTDASSVVDTVSTDVSISYSPEVLNLFSAPMRKAFQNINLIETEVSRFCTATDCSISDPAGSPVHMQLVAVNGLRVSGLKRGVVLAVLSAASRPLLLESM